MTVAAHLGSLGNQNNTKIWPELSGGVGCEPLADKDTSQVREGMPGIYTGQKKEGPNLNLWLVEV